MESTLIPDWSELHSDILEYLTSFLSLSNYIRFSAVCQNWFSVAKQKRHSPRRLPWLVMGEDGTTHKRKFYSIDEKKHYLIDIPELRGQRLCGSSYGWLFTMDIELNFLFLNPFTKKCYDLPPLPPYDKYTNTPYIKVSQSDEDYTFADMQLFLVSKAILDCDPSKCSDFKVLITYGSNRKLAYWCFGDSAWTLIQGVYATIDDIIFFKENFYAIGNLCRHNEIYVVNVGPDPKIKRVGPKVPVHDSFSYLVDYMGPLLVVQRWRKELKRGLIMTKKVIVKTIDLEEENYHEYKPMDGHAVFMGANSCVTVDASKYDRCKMNALYLTDMPLYYTEEFGCKDLQIYNMDQRSFSRYYSFKPYIPFVASPIWFIPNLR
ncbi:F-box/kelch-repeat protein At1g57790-like [Carex rostrata]